MNRLCKIIALLAVMLQAGPVLAQREGTLVHEQIRSESLTGSKIGISPVRGVSVYLPPAYSDRRRRFPVVYLLNHFFENDRTVFANNGAKELLDKAIADGVIGDVILVTADFSTPAGSSWYVNSPVTGNWEDFMMRELVPHIDATYRTLATRDSRAVLGDGVGGYGAIRYGMRRPDLFGVVYAMQPVGTGSGVQATHSRPNYELLARVGSLDEVGDDGFSRIFTSIYQAFSPNPDRSPLFFDPPVRIVDGQKIVDSAIMARFHAGLGLLEMVPAYADNLKSLRGFKFDWGRADAIYDHIYANQALATRLTEFGVPYEGEEHGGGFRDRHWGEHGRVYTDALPFIAQHLLFGAPATAVEKAAAAHGSLRDAILSNDVDARLRHYRSDARSMPEYQPALYGTGQIAAYHRVMRERRAVRSYVPVASEVFDLGDTLLEIGTFTISWSLANGGAEEEKGKYANVWSVESNGTLRLKADVWGYFRPLPDSKAFFVAVPEGEPPARKLSEGESRLAETLAALNQKNATAVRTRDVEAKLAEYTEDAIMFPFADTPKVGMGQMRPYMIAYTAAGEGVSFDDVRVWNAGFEDLGTHVIEYSKFHVDWRYPGNDGMTKGGGLRFWKRHGDGTLKLFRQIGTHDHVE